MTGTLASTERILPHGQSIVPKLTWDTEDVSLAALGALTGYDLNLHLG